MVQGAEVKGDLKLRCYCCGAKITGGQIALVSLGDSADRVFVMLPEHAERAKNAKVMIVEPM